MYNIDRNIINIYLRLLVFLLLWKGHSKLEVSDTPLDGYIQANLGTVNLMNEKYT